jgi:hypothetical protein
MGAEKAARSPDAFDGEGAEVTAALAVGAASGGAAWFVAREPEPQVQPGAAPVSRMVTKEETTSGVAFFVPIVVLGQ